MEPLTQPEFIEKYKKGEKVFESKMMQFFDISGMSFEGLSFKNCSLFLCTFRNCSFKDVYFENCNIYTGSFYSGESDSLVFEKCSIEMTLFDSFQFSRTSMNGCDVRWLGMINSNSRSVDLSTSSQFKVITDISQLTPSDVESIVSEIMQNVERLDVGLRLKVKELIRQDLDRYKMDGPEDEGKTYSSGDQGDSPLTYGEVKGMVENFFYGTQSPYKTKKSAYETDNQYKK